MPATKHYRGEKQYTDLEEGRYQIGYKKDNGDWVPIPELEFTVPSNRKANPQIMVMGEEVDA